MNLWKILGELSSPTKFKIMSLLWDCKHENIAFSTLQKSFELSQANISKQSKEMIEAGIIIKEKKGREVFFKINNEFKMNNFNIVNPILNSKEALQYKCICFNGVHVKAKEVKND